MAQPNLNGGAVVGVRLSDIPIKIRRRRGKALYDAAVADRDISLAVAINAAIERPSDRIYWISREAVSRELA